MYALLKLITISILCSYTLVGCISTKQIATDLSQDDILSLYQKKWSDSTNTPSIKPVKDWEGIYVIGELHLPYGYLGDKIAVGKNLGTWQDLMPKTLYKLGWKDKDKRAQLALKWAIDVIHAWESPILKEEDVFGDILDAKSLLPSVKEQDGNWVIEVWIFGFPDANSCHTGDGRYTLRQIIINKKAEFVSQKDLKSFYAIET